MDIPPHHNNCGRKALLSFQKICEYPLRLNDEPKGLEKEIKEMRIEIGFSFRDIFVWPDYIREITKYECQYRNAD